MFDKSQTNFIIDALMFLCMMAMVGIGFLMKFVLIPGKDRWVEYGRNVELYLYGMDRHQWGTIHLILGFILLGLLILHIVLHWKMILNLYKCLVRSQIARRITAAAFIIGCAILLAFSLVVKAQVQELERGEGRGRRGYVGERQNTIAPFEKESVVYNLKRGTGASWMLLDSVLMVSVKKEHMLAQARWKDADIYNLRRRSQHVQLAAAMSLAASPPRNGRKPN